MSSIIHFKFRSALLNDSVNFDGDYVSLMDLKRLIAKKKGLTKAVDIDLQLTDADTNEGLCVQNSCATKKHAVAVLFQCRAMFAVLIDDRFPFAEYKDEEKLIPKNTSVLVKKVNVKVQISALNDDAKLSTCVFHNVFWRDIGFSEAPRLWAAAARCVCVIRKYFFSAFISSPSVFLVHSPLSFAAFHSQPESTGREEFCSLLTRLMRKVDTSVRCPFGNAGN